MALLLLTVQYLLYVLFRKLFSLVQGLYWLITGTLWHAKNPENYATSGQLMTVAGRMKFDLIAQPSGSENFVTFHEQFVHPRYVLRDNVTLYSCTDSEAVFVETDADVDVTSLDVSCFMRVAQFQNARRIIKLPVESVNRLAEEIGDPDGQLIIVTSTARCGSTLLCQVFAETNTCASYSEPDYFHVINAYRNKLPQEQMERLLRNLTRLLCKPVSTKPNVKAHLIKPIAHFVTAVPLFLKVFPESRQLFMYRDGLKVTRSMLKMFDQVPISQVMVFVSTYLPRIFRFFTSYSVHFPEGDLPDNMCEDKEFGTFIWAVTCRCYNQLHASGYDISALKYEHLVTHPLQSIRAILHYCRLPEEWARSGLKAMGKDSQRGSLISKANLGQKDQEMVLSAKNKVVVDSICDQMGLPRIDKPCSLPDTINDPDVMLRHTEIH